MASQTNSVSQSVTPAPLAMNEKGVMTIGTHNGPFQCDEVTACVLLELYYKSISVTRTRDSNTLNALDLVVDVGGVDDAEKGRFDHHQQSFARCFDASSLKVRLSSVGLVYNVYGKAVIASFVVEKNISFSAAELDAFFVDFYHFFIKPIDAHDNGVAPCDGAENYRDSTTLSARVSRLYRNGMNQAEEDAAFHKAMELVRDEFLSLLEYQVEAVTSRRAIVTAAFDNKEASIPQGVLLLSEWCKYSDYLKVLERERQTPTIYFVVFWQVNVWKVQFVEDDKQFVARLSMPQAWRGKSTADLKELTGLGDVVFVHASGNFAACKSKESALLLASKAIHDAFGAASAVTK